MRRRTGASLGGLVAAAAVAAAAAACGGGEARPAASAPVPEAPPAAPEPSQEPVVLRRSAVRAAVAGGLGRVLRHVEVDERPVVREGRFVGFRVLTLRGDFARVGLAPGDVVTGVNGQGIERPEAALAAFETLARAPSLRVAYEREGKPAEVLVPIVEDDPDAGAPAPRP